MPDKSLKNKTALITGASRLQGIGAAIARKLAAAGADIYFTYWLDYDRKMPWGVEKNEPEELQQSIQKMGVKCFKKEIDLAEPENIRLLLADVKAKLTTPDILVNNACYSTNNNYQNIEVEELDKHYEINLKATLLLSSYFARSFNKTKGGRIINLSSGQFKGPMENEIAYAATKGAVDALTISLAAELAAEGITVNAVNPGPTDTGWMDQKLREELLNKFPQGRIGQPEDAAELVKFLASGEAEWITGEIINSEGGFKR
ncbi:MAG: SDR family oxidoreductase [Halanaerobium sp.]